MNNPRREDLDEQYLVRDEFNNISHQNKFKYIKRYKSVGFSKMFTCKAMGDGRNGIKAGDLVYFKVNNDRGVNPFGRTSESDGSCEDIAEVLAFYLLENLNKNKAEVQVLKGTPYDFAEYESFDTFMGETSGSSFIYDARRLYGCISKNALSSGAEILHGNTILKFSPKKEKADSLSSNTIFNYEQSLIEMQKEYENHHNNIILDPICTRNLANLLFFDYFYTNSDRHCLNVCFEKVPLTDGSFLIQPLSVLDNGGGLAMQSPNCSKLYREQSEVLQNLGKLKDSETGFQNPFDVSYSLDIGRESFLDNEIMLSFDALPYPDKIALFISQNKTLYQDFKKIYKNLDISTCLKQMKDKLGFPVLINSELNEERNFLPNMQFVIEGIIRYKRCRISMSIAKMLGEEFDESIFDRDENYYLDKFEPLVQENNLSVHIASDEEVLGFKKHLSENKLLNCLERD